MTTFWFVLEIIINHPLLTVAGILLLLMLWWAYTCIPETIEYYRRNDGSIGFPFDWEWNEREAMFTYLIGSTIGGRLKVLRFAHKHGLKLHIAKAMFMQVVEIFLASMLIPEPRKWMWESCLFGMRCYPLGRSRLQWVKTCIKHRWLPWIADEEVRRILDANNSRFYKNGIEAKLY